MEIYFYFTFVLNSSAALSKFLLALWYISIVRHCNEVSSPDQSLTVWIFLSLILHVIAEII